MYGDDEDSGAEDNRPLSFVASKSSSEQLGKAPKPDDPADDRLRLVRTTSDQTSTATTPSNAGPNGNPLRKTQTFPSRIPTERSNSHDGSIRSPLSPLSPTPSLRDVQADDSGFPLTNIDNANDIAQELSNLQALRRMSMDVSNTHDPDLLPFSGVSLMAMPSIAPTGDDDEADPSRLLWVPARVHPELDTGAFKTFLENRVQTMKRRSGDSFLSVDGAQGGGGSGSLRRKKSMLSRQVNTHTENGDGYTDGAERLRRNGSLAEYATPELSLNELVNDPTGVVQKLAHDARGEEGGADSPILPVAPGMGLRRSTKTTYRKGGSQRFAKKLGEKQVASKMSAEEPPPLPAADPTIGKPLTRVMSEPIAENYSRPTRTVRRQQNFSRDGPDSTAAADQEGETASSSPPSSPPRKQPLPVRAASAAARTTTAPPIPQIVETPPVDESSKALDSVPERSTSQKSTEKVQADQPPVEGPPARSNKRPPPSKPAQPVASSANPLEKISHPEALPDNSNSTTSSLTFIPTFDTVEKKADRKSKDKDETESIVSTKSTSSWKWFKSGDKEKKKKEKEKEEEREREEHAKKAKSKSAEKGHDNARLDVLQNSIDNPKGRESLRLDRESIEGLPQEEKKKDAMRKSSDSKRGDGFFGGLFGGSKKKSEKEAAHKKDKQRALSPEPPIRILRPDIDYHWTRFPIIEERAIYRMAHIKLANPRRPLHSQVLLSNFMYSYLAKVQAMHPQLNVPISPQQKRQEEERKRREAEQQALEQQMAAQQAAQDGSFDFEYHRSGSQYGDSPVQGDDSVQYVDDSQIYEYEHGGQQQYQQNGVNGNGQQQGNGSTHQHDQNYYYAQGDGNERNDMW
ncbi:hypothetical protein QBC40DRAFT_106087 [Triangularia verruculosa]|uniref:Protein Zds1 C-terminal domain-containing protein n=1 Tax=Triangularia verruculosa TaxID=2587418 RepID=A0AAN7ATW0_9PEZI|nr:hypothetical protein QBC40DRAFT_106087 [Triangularia verruculosa]